MTHLTIEMMQEIGGELLGPTTGPIYFIWSLPFEEEFCWDCAYLRALRLVLTVGERPDDSDEMPPERGDWWHGMAGLLAEQPHGAPWGKPRDNYLDWFNVTSPETQSLDWVRSWLGGSSRNCEEADGPLFCEDCGCPLMFSATEHALEQEIEHFEMYGFAFADLRGLSHTLELNPAPEYEAFVLDVALTPDVDRGARIATAATRAGVPRTELARSVERRYAMDPRRAHQMIQHIKALGPVGSDAPPMAMASPEFDAGAYLRSLAWSLS